MCCFDFKYSNFRLFCNQYKSLLINILFGGIFAVSLLRFRHTMKAYLVRIIIIGLLCLCISSCGNKGDLYMPDKDKIEQSS